MIVDNLYRTILDRIPQLVLVISIVRSPEGDISDFRFEYINQAWEQISGSTMNTVEGKLFSSTVYVKSNIPFLNLVREAANTQKTVRTIEMGELFNKRLEIQIINIDETLLIMNVADITESWQTETRIKEQNMRLSTLSTELVNSKNNLKQKLNRIETLNTNLEQMAFYDRLTGLPNRIRFNAILTDQIDSAQRANKRFALAIIDVDNLKIMNDSLGHDAGDTVLKQMGERLREFEKDNTQSSRFGGDEFLIVIHDYDHDAELIHLINKIKTRLGEPYQWKTFELRTTVSTGATVYPDDTDNLEDLLKYADIAMSDAKRRGKNTLSLFHSVMQETLLERLRLEDRMTDTFEKGLFQVFFQPQVNVETGSIRGFEALVRWFDVQLGYISPDRFIPLAEETRLIIQLGDWILDTACKVFAGWRSELDFKGIMSVNVSPVQLKCSDFPAKLASVLKRYNIDPGSLEIEITEGVLVNNYDEMIEILNRIRNMGVRISLDDFGTGYSSLSYLQFIPLTTLKIDKTFIANITKDGSVEYEITSAIVSLVNKLGLDTVAEGVETLEQLELVRAIECKTIQGFLTGKAVPQGECERIIRYGTGLVF